MGSSAVTVNRSREATADRRAEIVKLTRLGLSARDIAVNLGITKRSVYRGRTFSGVAQPKHPLMTQSEKCTAQTMLDDGASYGEAGRTIGRAAATIKKHLPGYTFDKQQSAEASALGRAMARLDRQTPAAATGNCTTRKAQQ